MQSNTEFKQYLEKEKQRLTKLLARTHKHLHRDEPVSADFAEQAVETANDQVVESLDHEAGIELAQIKRALIRIEDDTFGDCTECGRPINIKRLQAIPYTELCIECAQQLESKV